MTLNSIQVLGGVQIQEGSKVGIKGKDFFGRDFPFLYPVEKIEDLQIPLP
jgi:hypothetical protein